MGIPGQQWAPGEILELTRGPRRARHGTHTTAGVAGLLSPGCSSLAVGLLGVYGWEGWRASLFTWSDSVTHSWRTVRSPFLAVAMTSFVEVPKLMSSFPLSRVALVGGNKYLCPSYTSLEVV